MNIILSLTLLAAAVSGLFALTRQLQMLQQNSYFPSRYFKWVKDGYVLPFAFECFGYCIFDLLLAKKLYLPLFVFTLCVLLLRVLLAIRYQRKSIKKLVFTARIKRFYATGALLLALCLVMHFLFPEKLVGEIFTVILCSLSFISPLFCLACRFITAPIDRAVTKYYINDAKRILKEHKNLIVIGITGSYGKTTVKFILKRILSEKYNVVATPQSFNTPMGVVRTIRESLQPQTQVFICEMGAKNIGDIKEICDIVHPKYGIITSVGAQHLETFKTVDNVFKTKFELADAVFRNGGSVFVNGDSEELMKRLADSSLYNIYGTDKSFEFYAHDIAYGRNGSAFTADFGQNEIALSSKLLGLHGIIDITGAAALAYSLGVTPENIKYAVASLKPTEHRLELKPYICGSTLIDDAYNANPEGCIEAVRVLSSFNGMKKVIVTPGLIELGSREYDCNFALGVEAAKLCDIIILVGINRSKPIKDGIESVGFDSDRLYTVSSFKEAMKLYSSFADTNTAVLLENDLPDNYLN